MCMIDAADGHWLRYSSTKRRARKAHRCDECRRGISAGETYRHASGLESEGPSWVTHRMCAHCDQAKEWLVRTCNGYVYETIREDLQEHWSQSAEYHSPWLARAIVGMRRQWRTRKGALMAVPEPCPALPWEGAER